MSLPVFVSMSNNLRLLRSKATTEARTKARESRKKGHWAKTFDEMTDKEVENVLNLVDGQRIPEEWFLQLMEQIKKRKIDY